MRPGEYLSYPRFMALLAESLVEEWLNRNRFFTIRGLKHGVGEIDLLGIRLEADGSVTGRHVEVQASFRPIGYISKLTDTIAKESGKGRASAVARTSTQMAECAREWVDSKFRAPQKVKIREQMWPDANWSYHLVHAVVREDEEIRLFETEGVQCHSFDLLLRELSQRQDQAFCGSAGGDLAEIVGYFSANMNSSE